MVEFGKIEELAVGWFDRGEIGYAKTLEEFTPLKSGRRSPNYVNGRRIMSFSKNGEVEPRRQLQIAKLTIYGLAHAIDHSNSDYDHLANVPQAINPVVGALAWVRGDSLLNVRTKEGDKGYGQHDPIEGLYEEGELVIGIDNVISDGGTKMEFMEPIGLCKLVLQEFVVIVDREEGGAAALHQQGIGLSRVMAMGQVTDILLDHGRINAQQAEWSHEYIARYNHPLPVEV